MRAAARLQPAPTVVRRRSRLSQSATIPAIPEHVAADDERPGQAEQLDQDEPAANVPMIAPNVFAAYSGRTPSRRCASRVS